MKTTILLLPFLMISLVSQAQTGKSVVMNAGKNAKTLHTKVKWYSESVYYERGVNIYRSEVGSKNWIKLNDKPIEKGHYVTISELKDEPNLNVLAEIANKKSGKELEGLVKLSVLIQSILSERFAHYLGLQFNDSTVELGKQYQYRIMEVLSGEKESLISKAGPVAVKYQTKPNPPAGIVLSADEGSVRFNWKIEEDRFFAVNIYRSTASGGKKKKLNNRPVIVSSYEDERGKLSYPEYFFVDDSVRSGQEYYYQLASIDYFGYESVLSEEFLMTTSDKTPPPAPRLRQTQKDRIPTLRWKQRIVDDLAGYNIYRSRVGDSTYIMINDALVSPETDYWEVTDNQPGSYWYYVETEDTSGNTARSEQVLVNIPDEVAPDAPTGVEVVIEPGKVILKWAENKEPDLLGYQVFRALNRGDTPYFYPMFVQPQENTIYEQQIPLVSKETYVYKVAAVDTSFNRSAFSVPVKVQLPDVVPPEVPHLKDVYALDGFIKIEWLSHSGQDIQQYTLLRSEGDSEFRQLATLSASSNEYTDREVKPGITYNYQIQATDSAGNTSAPSPTLTSSVREMEGSTITALKGKYRKRQSTIQLEWEVTHSEKLKGFVIYQAQDSKELRPITGLLKERTFNTKPMLPGNNYQYQVRAFDHSGNVFKSKIFEITIKE